MGAVKLSGLLSLQDTIPEVRSWECSRTESSRYVLVPCQKTGGKPRTEDEKSIRPEEGGLRS